jgi:hypothetical protein
VCAGASRSRLSNQLWMGMNTSMSMSMSILQSFSLFGRGMAFGRALRGKISRGFILAYTDRRIWCMRGFTFSLAALVTGMETMIALFSPKLCGLRNMERRVGGHLESLQSATARLVLAQVDSKESSFLHGMALNPAPSPGCICIWFVSTEPCGGTTGWTGFVLY